MQLQRRSALIHWLGLISIVVSLFTPLITADAFAEPPETEPDVALIQEASTPEAPVIVEPTAGPTVAEPTIAPTPESESTSEPAPEPTAEPEDRPSTEARPGIGIQAAGITISIDAPPTIVPGDTLTYNITLTNSGASTFYAFLRATLPIIAGSTWSLDASAGFDCMRDGTVVDCTAMPLNSNQTMTVTIQTDDTDTLSCGDTLTIWALSSSGGSTPKTTSVTCPQADVAITKIAPLATVAVGDTASFTITVSNDGDATSQPYGLQDRLPNMGEGTSWRIADSDFGVTCALSTKADGQYLDCYVNPLAPEESRSITVEQLVTGEVCGDITNTVELYDAEQTIHDSAAATITVTCQPNVSVTMSGPATATFGNSLSQTLTVTNSGTAPASNVVVSLPLPVPLQQISWGSVGRCDGNFPAGPATCTIDSLGPNQSVIFTATFRPTSSTCGPFAFQATLSGGATGTSNTVTTNVLCPDITIDVSGPATITPGQDLAYDITVTNAGPVQASNVSIESQLPAIGSDWTIDAGAPSGCSTAGDLLTCEGLELAPDSDSLTITVTGTVGATPSVCGGHDVVVSLTDAYTGTSNTVTTEVTCTPEMELTTTVTAVRPATGAERPVSPGELVTSLQPGDIVVYRMVATNTGDVALTNVTLTDTLTTITGCDPAVPATLAPGGTITCDATYTVTEADLLTSGMTNVTTATSTQTSSRTASATVYPALPSPKVNLTKSAIAVNGDSIGGTVEGLVLGDVVTYELVATNTGNISVNEVTIGEQPGVTLDECEPANLAPGNELRCEATYTITQADIDRGEFTNTASVTGTAVNDAPVSATATATVRMLQAPALDFEVTDTYMDPTEDQSLGSVTYAITATNTGNTTLTGVTLAEHSPLNLVLTCSIGDEPAEESIRLGLGEALICTATHVVTQPQLDLGSIDMSAWIDSDQTDRTFDSATTTLPRNPAISVDTEAIAIPDAGFDRFEEVTYTIEVENTGNVTLTGINVTHDNRSVQVDCSIPGSGPTSSFWLLAPGEKRTCTATYTVQQEDVEIGTVTNTTRVSADAPNGTEPAKVTASDETTVPTDNTPGITLRKNVQSNAMLMPGNTYQYTLVATNTGKVALTDVEIVDDSLPGLSDLSCRVGNDDVEQPVVLLHNRDLICIATYTVTQADLDRGIVVNEASVSGVYNEETVSDTATATFDDQGARNPAIQITTSAEPGAMIEAGAQIPYTYQVRNTGNVTLTNVVVTDDTIDGIVCGDDGNVIARLAPNTPAVECTGTLTITQEFIDSYELDEGEWGMTLTTTARVVADAPPGMEPAQVSGEGQASIWGLRLVRIDLYKAVTQIDGEGVTPGEAVTGLKAGQVVTYTLTATNTGQVTLNDVAIIDSLLADLSCDETTLLAPGGTVTCTGTLTITQEIFDTDFNRIIENRGDVTANDPQGMPVSDWHAVAIYLEDVAPALSLVASVSPESVDAPQDVTFTLTVTNSGNISLEGVYVAYNPALDMSGVDCDPETDGAQTTIATLGVDASATCTLPYRIIQEQIDAGDDIVMTFTMGGFPEIVGRVLSNETSATVSMEQRPAIEVTRTVVGNTTDLALGDTVEYTISITNTGNVTIPSVIVTDDMATPHDCTELGRLFVGETIECSAQYVITEADIIAGEVTTTATVTAITRGGAEIPAEASARVTTEAPASSITLETTILDATGAPAENASLGDAITFSFEVRNTGNITVNGIAVESEMLAAAGIEIPAIAGLAPGETATVTAVYTVAAADVEAGVIVSEATATGIDVLHQDVISPMSRISVTAIQNPVLELGVEVVTPDAGATEGSSIGLLFTVTNNGDVTLRDVEITTDLDGIEWAGDNAELASLVFMAQTTTGGTIGDLAPGESVTARASYTITAADIEAGTLQATVIAIGSDPNGEVISSLMETIMVELLQPDPEPGATASPDASSTPASAGEPITKLPSTGTGGVMGMPAMVWIVAASLLAVVCAVGLRTRAMRG